jgi:ParB family chromosome partitioning protein
VCGQGRLEAFIELKQDAIPAIIIDADETDCLVMSLVENCARRQHSPIDLMREIGNLRKRGYNGSPDRHQDWRFADYVGMIAGLLERGEERLVTAVETGLLPLNLAIDISKTDAEGAQRALMDAYTQKKLRGKKLAAARRLIEQREARGKKMHPKPYGRDGRTRRPLTSEALVRAYQKEASRQKLLIKKAELTQGRLLFICQAFRDPPRGRSFRDAAARGRPGPCPATCRTPSPRGMSAMTKKVQHSASRTIASRSQSRTSCRSGC